MKNLIPIALIVVAAGLFFTVIDPQYQGDPGGEDVTSLKSKVKELDRALDTSHEVKRQQNALFETEKSFSDSDNKKLETFLPVRTESIKFILDMNYVADLHNITLKNIRVDQSQAASEETRGRRAVPEGGAFGGHTATSFGFSVKTSYEGFLSFLHDIERSLRLIDVTSINFTSTDSNIYEFAVAGRIYSVE